MITQRSLKLFHKAAREVPAYADFLKERGLNPQSIVTVQNFKQVPVTIKKNYLQQYPLPDLLWGGGLDKPLIFCATSGSTGEPYYFPRDDKLAWQYSFVVEDFLRRGQVSEKKPALVIVAFGMGI